MPEYWKTTQFVLVFSHASSAQSAVIQFTPNTNRIGIMASTTTTFSLQPGTVSNEPFDWTKSNDLKVHKMAVEKLSRMSSHHLISNRQPPVGARQPHLIGEP